VVAAKSRSYGGAAHVTHSGHTGKAIPRPE